MATYTPNLNLKKPSTGEYYDMIADLNDTKDKIDIAIGNHTLNVKAFGAIGDGLTHPLSSKYGTLSSAQIIYPFATSLDQEIDWCAFVKMFRLAKETNRPCFIPTGQYYIIAPLEDIGNSSVGSTEFGNFKIEGAGVAHTELHFGLTVDSQIAMNFVEQSNAWDISGFRVKNITPGKFGTGIHLPSTYKTSLKNIQVIYFNIGLKTNSYITNFINVDCANNNCGFYFINGTSTSFISCYAEYNQKSVGDIRTNDYMGCGYFFHSGAYTSLSGCASDSNDIAYKVKNETTYLNYTGTQLTFNDCGTEGCKEAWNIDAADANIIIRNPLVFDTLSKKIAHVENATLVTIEGLSDNTNGNVTKGANVGVGVIKLINGYPTGGNPSTFPINTPTLDKFGIDDFAYEGINLSGSNLTIGRLIKKASFLELELYAISAGQGASAEIDVEPFYNYSGASINRGGKVTVGTNFGGTTNISKSNPDILVTATTITNGVRFKIEPFNGLTGAASSEAIFKVTTCFSSVGVDGQSKNHNIKQAGTYSGRINCRLQGVDY